MRWLLYIFIMFAVTGSATAQIDNDGLLRQFTRDEGFLKYVLQQKCNNRDTIYIIDTAGYFKHNFRLNSQTNIVITHQYNIPPLPDPPIPEVYFAWLCNHVLITEFVTRNGLYRIRYSHPPSAGAGFIEYRLRKGRLQKVKEQFGQF